MPTPLKTLKTVLPRQERHGEACKILKAVFAAFSFRLPLLPAPVGTAVQLLRVLLFALFLDK